MSNSSIMRRVEQLAEAAGADIVDHLDNDLKQHAGRVLTDVAAYAIDCAVVKDQDTLHEARLDIESLLRNVRPCGKTAINVLARDLVFEALIRSDDD